MYNLRIEHPVPDYDNWKKAFDSDPVDRKKSGVLAYQISRSVDNPNYVIIDLQFKTASEAEALLAAMRSIWSLVQGSIMNDPKARISEVVETKTI
jgi:ribosomal protein L35AE/L33A